MSVGTGTKYLAAHPTYKLAPHRPRSGMHKLVRNTNHIQISVVRRKNKLTLYQKLLMRKIITANNLMS